MKRIAVILFLSSFAACHHEHGDSHHDHGAAAPAPSGVNAVQHEMHLLQDAMRDTVSAIAAGNVKSVPESLHKVHAAKEATEAAIEGGKYKLPKNADGLAKFKERDEAFHAKLEKLVEAASKNDVDATAAAFGEVMNGCNGCHTEFR